MALPVIGDVLKLGAGALKIGDKVADAIPGPAESAIRQDRKRSSEALKRNQYGYSKAEKEQKLSGIMGDAARFGGFSGTNPYQLNKGITTLGQQIQQRGTQQLAKALTGQRGSAGVQVDAASRQAGQEAKALDKANTLDLVAQNRKGRQKITGPDGAISDGFDMAASMFDPTSGNKSVVSGIKKT